jgi:hypothetical protein
MSGDGDNGKQGIEREAVKNVVDALGKVSTLPGWNDPSPTTADYKIHSSTLLEAALGADIGGDILVARFLMWESVGAKRYEPLLPLIFLPTFGQAQRKRRAAEFLTYISLSSKLAILLGGTAGLVRNVADKQPSPTIFHNKDARHDDFSDMHGLKRIYTRKCDARPPETCTVCSCVRTKFLDIARTIIDGIMDPRNCETEDIKQAISNRPEADLIVESLRSHKMNLDFSALSQWEHAAQQIPLVDAWLSSVSNPVELWVFPSPSNIIAQDFKYHGAVWLLVGQHSPIDFLKWKVVIREVFWRGFWNELAEERYRARLMREVEKKLKDAEQVDREAESLERIRSLKYREIQESISDTNVQGQASLAFLEEHLQRHVFPVRPYPSWVHEIGTKKGDHEWNPHNLSSWPSAIKFFVETDEWKRLLRTIRVAFKKPDDFKIELRMCHLAALKSLSSRYYERGGKFSPFVLEFYFSDISLAHNVLTDQKCVLKGWKLNKGECPKLLDVLKRFQSFFTSWEGKFVDPTFELDVRCINGLPRPIMICRGGDYDQKKWSKPGHGTGTTNDLATAAEQLRRMDIEITNEPDGVVLGAKANLWVTIT